MLASAINNHILTNSFNAIESLFKSVIKFSQIWILSRSPRISFAMSRSSLAYILSRLYSLHQPQYPTTALDVIYSIVQCLLSRNTFLHFSTSHKATQATAYFYLLIIKGVSEERLAVMSLCTISMRYKRCKVNSFSQEFPKFFLY